MLLIYLFICSTRESLLLESCPPVKMDLDPRVTRREVLLLQKMGFLRKRVYSKEITKKRGKKIIVKRKRTQGFNLEPKFPHINVLNNLLIDTNLIRRKDILRKLQSCG